MVMCWSRNSELSRGQSGPTAQALPRSSSCPSFLFPPLIILPIPSFRLVEDHQTRAPSGDGRQKRTRMTVTACEKGRNVGVGVPGAGEERSAQGRRGPQGRIRGSCAPGLSPNSLPFSVSAPAPLRPVVPVCGRKREGRGVSCWASPPLPTPVFSFYKHGA